MTNLRWLAITGALFGVTLVVTGWSPFRDLAHQREWQASVVSSSEAELAGIRVGVREVKAAVIDNKPDRGLLFVRIDLQGPKEAMDAWLECRVTLQTPDGRMWQPLSSYEARGAIRMVASDGKSHDSCYPPSVHNDAPTVFDQLYRIPTAVLDELTLHVSGFGTRPEALAFELDPEVRTFKTQ